LQTVPVAGCDLDDVRCQCQSRSQLGPLMSDCMSANCTMPDSLGKRSMTSFTAPLIQRTKRHLQSHSKHLQLPTRDQAKTAMDIYYYYLQYCRHFRQFEGSRQGHYKASITRRLGYLSCHPVDRSSSHLCPSKLVFA